MADDDVEERIRTLVDEKAQCSLEEIVAALPEHSWSQIFLAVDRLSRAGRIRLKRTDGRIDVMRAGPGALNGK